MLKELLENPLFTLVCLFWLKNEIRDTIREFKHWRELRAAKRRYFK